MNPAMPDYCGICHGDPRRRVWVNTELAKPKYNLSRMERESRELGMNVKRETIRRHVNVCVANGIHDMPVAMIASKPAPQSNKSTQFKPAPGHSFDSLPENTDDFATLVKHAAVEKLRKGELRISTQDGLAAQALIDKRLEKQKDRDIFARVGAMLAGALSTPPPIVIEGEFIEDSNDSHPLLTDGTGSA
jgi:hypothetical protein